MKRSAGVTAAAVVLFIGSGFLVLMGIVTVLTVIFLKTPPNPQITASQQEIQSVGMIIGCAFYLILAAWGIVTGIGLFRLRKWARISVLVMGVVAVVSCLLMAIMMTIIFKMMSAPQAPQALLAAKIAMFGIFGLPAAIALWWILLFTRKSIKQQFAGKLAEPALDTLGVPPSGARPLSITIIAIFLMIGAPACIGSLLWGYSLAPQGFPVWFLGVRITGPGADFFYVITALIDLALGIGLWRIKPWARTGAIAWGFFSLLNIGCMILRAADLARTMDAMSRTMATPVTFHVPIAFVHIILAFAFIPLLVGLWFLIKRKSAFVLSPVTQEA